MATSSKGIAIAIQDRDVKLLVDLYESRIMTLEHAAALHFDCRREAAKKRVQKLKAAGFIKERPRRPNEPSILQLTRKAFRYLDDGGHLVDLPAMTWTAFQRRASVSEFTIRHELDVMSVRAAMVAAVRREPHLEVAEFSTWPRLFQFRASVSSMNTRYGRDVLVKPDGFIRIREHESDGEQSEHTFFLEVDRSTETLDRLAAKATCFVNYYKSGDFAVKQGAARNEYQAYPFRVLMVFKTAERRDNAARRLLEIHPPILTQVWLATMSDATARYLDSIWVKPQDFRDRRSREAASLVPLFGINDT